MTDTTESTTFAACLRKHLATRLRGPRRLKAARAADDGFVAEVLEGHHIALRQAVSGARAELQEVIDVLTAVHDGLQQRFDDLQTETQRRDRAHDTVVAGFRADLAKLNGQLETSEREASALRDELARAQARLVTEGERDTILADLGELLTVTGLGDHARPQPPHEVFQEALAAVRSLRGELTEARAKADTVGGLREQITALHRKLAGAKAAAPANAAPIPVPQPVPASPASASRKRSPLAAGTSKAEPASGHPGAAKP